MKMPFERDDDDLPTIVTIIPAQPGWFLYDFWEGDTPDQICSNWEPIIAWRIETKDHTGDHNWQEYKDHLYPIHLDHVNPPAEDRGVIKRPDGTLVCPGDRTFQNQEELEQQAKEWIREYDARLERMRVRKPVAS